MSKNSTKQLYRQLLRFINELNFGKGHVRVKNKYGAYIKVRKDERTK